MSDFTKCVLLLPLNGTNNGTTFTDWSPVPKSPTVSGDTKTVTAQYKYYGSSLYLDGSSDYLQYSDSADWNFGSGDFTIEGWFRIETLITVNSTYMSLVTQRASSTSNYAFTVEYGKNSSGTVLLQVGVSTSGSGATSTAAISPWSPSAGQWYHFAAVRNSSTLKLYLDGTEAASAAVSGTLYDSSATLKIGSYNTTAAAFFKGWLQDIRITKGVALYTAGFTPPGRLLGVISNADGLPVRGADGRALTTGNLIFVPRDFPTRATTANLDGDGRFSVSLPAYEHAVILRAPDDSFNDRFLGRVLPA